MSIRLRLTLYWAAITAMILIAAGLVICFSFARELWSGFDGALLEEADTGAAALSRSGLAIANEILHRLAQEKDLSAGRKIRLIVGNRIVFEEGDAHAQVPDAESTPLNATLIDGTNGYRFAIVPVTIDGEPGWLQDGADSSRLRATIRELRRRLLVTIPLILLGSVVVGYWFAGKALEPLNAISGHLSVIGARDLGKRLPLPNAHDEAARLIESINDLLSRLEKASNTQRRFISEAAHELRTPLTVLLSGLEVTLQKPRDCAEYVAALEDACSDARRLCALAEDLLALTRVEAAYEAGDESIDLGELARDACEAMKPLSEARHQTFLIETAPALGVRGNRADLRRVAINLLDNAIKFGGERGEIEVAANRNNGFASLSVRDNGPGLGVDEPSRMFDPFYRGPGSSGAGSGLGLALCREIVEAHGGRIEALDREGAGCEIRVSLPLCDD